ncbi:hypothetical protein M427DRAFT_453364 [Gonapodya prolifera JEL478]|uniref:Uncharacterized protein n=1 Tax=Gonapodya prolifera (strain JEL478) TaxID=1344416 RepID=A0A139ASP0_GONPJ|nr:hypothetical protein M427DRAFT_453364 [Gonapodya prolifera JEL478]|eukprot:KXS19563.1 hypothetical protein M427DRAFT_453364 [Gonapodya prolifera JEL478]
MWGRSAGWCWSRRGVRWIWWTTSSHVCGVTVGGRIEVIHRRESRTREEGGKRAFASRHARARVVRGWLIPKVAGWSDTGRQNWSVSGKPQTVLRKSDGGTHSVSKTERTFGDRVEERESESESGTVCNCGDNGVRGERWVAVDARKLERVMSRWRRCWESVDCASGWLVVAMQILVHSSQQFISPRSSTSLSFSFSLLNCQSFPTRCFHSPVAAFCFPSLSLSPLSSFGSCSRTVSWHAPTS